MTQFQEARQIMGDTLVKDEGLHHGYRANVAMLLHDQYGITDYETRNKAADDILSLIFSLPPKQESKGKPIYCGGCGYTHIVGSKCPGDWADK